MHVHNLQHAMCLSLVLGEAALKRMQARVLEGQQLADKINEELLAHQAKIHNMTAKLEDTQSVLKRTGELLKYFGKQVMADRCLLCLIFLITLAAAGILVTKLTGKGNPIPATVDLKA